MTWLIRPEVPYGAVHSAAVGAGWTGGPVTLTPSLIRDEPELARFRRDGQVATYELDPVAMLRLWRAPSPPPDGLPLISEDDVLAMLAETGPTGSPEALLRGVLAAGELRLAKAVPGLLALSHRRLPPVVAAAVRASLAGITRDRNETAKPP